MTAKNKSITKAFSNWEYFTGRTTFLWQYGIICFMGGILLLITLS